MGWFLIIALWHLYAVQVLVLLCARALGEGTAPGIAWSLFAPWLGGAVGAWLLASWVALFHACEQGSRPHGATDKQLT